MVTSVWGVRVCHILCSVLPESSCGAGHLQLYTEFEATLGYMRLCPKQNRIKQKQRGSGEKGQRSGVGRAIHSGKLVFSRLGDQVWGLLEHTLPGKPLGDLEQRPFSNSLAVQKSLSASQTCLCHNLGAFCSEQPVLGLHFKASTEGSKSRLLWLSLP